MSQLLATASSPNDSLVSYYTNLRFNPVLIPVEEAAVWKSHFEKRRQLYERHLGLPLAYLEGASVLEFGPNSGENALLPALFGARLTLVEPNHQVLPRLRDLFNLFGVQGQIESVQCIGMDEFQTDRLFDLVVAEGFLFTLPNRDAMLRKMASLVRPGRYGVISYNDLCGGLLEYLRRAILFRCCELTGLTDLASATCLDLARSLYGDDFARLAASRKFEAWWCDQLVNPFCRSQHTWSLPDLLPILHEQDCEFHSTSPVWYSGDMFNWYKNVASMETRRQDVVACCTHHMAYFLTGLRPDGSRLPPSDETLIDDVVGLIKTLCDWVVQPGRTDKPVTYPSSLNRLLGESGDARLRTVNDEWKRIMNALNEDSVEALKVSYLGSEITRTLWGTAYHYLCFQRTPPVVGRV